MNRFDFFFFALPSGTSNGEKSPKPEFNLVTEKDYMKMLERMQIVKEDGIVRDFLFAKYPVTI